MIDANKAIFHRLARFCAARNDPLRNEGAPRWIATNSEDKEILMHATREGFLPFTSIRSISKFDLKDKNYFCAIGFDHIKQPSGLVEMDTNAGLLTLALSELELNPIASTWEIRDAVEGFDKGSDSSYEGHSLEKISTLYPKIRTFYGEDIASEETWRLFLSICIDECREGESWIDYDFALGLQRICGLEKISVPYNTLCRSIFDSDRAAMFLALYRCLEALYAYSSTQSIIDELQLSVEWRELASTLENQLGWYPHDDRSLERLLIDAPVDDIKSVFLAIGENCPDSNSDVRPYTMVARRIYWLRNSLVHYRPAHRKIDHSNVDWNRLCEAIAALVYHIYSKEAAL